MCLVLLYVFSFMCYSSVLLFLRKCLSHTTLCACVCVCASARVCTCSVLIQGSGWSCHPRGRSLAKPTQFFHIRHCNCGRWPGCLRLGTHTHNHALAHTHADTHMRACASSQMTQELPTANPRLLTNGLLFPLLFSQWRVSSQLAGL